MKEVNANAPLASLAAERQCHGLRIESAFFKHGASDRSHREHGSSRDGGEG
jgi:hypothetical protein